MPELDMGKFKIPYEVDWSPDRDSLGLTINNSQDLTVKAPTRSNCSDIEEFLDRKKNWIIEKRSEVEDIKKKPLEKEFKSGEKLLYKGRRYRLKVEETDVENPKLEKKSGKFFLKSPKELKGKNRQKKIKKAVKNWYKEEAYSSLSSRVDRFANKVGVNPSELSIKELSREWGNVKDKEIVLSWRAILAPVKIQDYLIVHELAHLKEGNHSNRFWNIIGSILPDYEERKNWLRVNGPILNI